MAIVSSILSIEVDELNRPLNIKAFDSGDTISSGILEDGVKTTLSSVTTSSIYWNQTYYKVLDRSATWEAGGEAQVPADVSGRWESAYSYLNTGGSSTIYNVSSTVYNNSGTWGAGGGGAIPSDVSGKWENAYQYLNNGASANIASTSSTVSNASGNWNSVYNRVLGTSSNWTSVYDRTLGSSGSWQNAFNYTNNASANISSASSTVNTVSGNWTNAYVYLNNGASANIASTSATVNNASGNWNSVYNRVLGTSANWTSVYDRTLGSSGSWQNAFDYTSNASANIASTSATVNNTSGNWNSVYNRVLGSSGVWQNAFNYTSNASANIASVSASVLNTSSNWNTAYSHSQLTNANPHTTDISALAGVSLDIPGLQGGQFLKYKPGTGWTNDSIAITNIATGGFGTISNTSALTFSATQGVSVQAVGTTLTFAISGNVSGATSSTNALSATSALNAQQAPNGFTVTGTLSATTISATTYQNVDHLNLLNIGTYSHASIDAHITDTGNPHSVTAEQVDNTTAQWNASALQGYEVKATAPTDRQTLLFISASNNWIPNYVLASDVGNTTSQWNASSLRGTSLSSTLSPSTGQSLVYSGTVWIASSISSVTNATSATNAFSSTNALSATSALNASRAPAGFNVTGTVAGVSATFSGTLSATTYLNLPSSTIVWASATSATNAFSSTNALSATNATRAPAGFNVSGTLAGVSATFSGTLSSTNLLTLSGDISATRLTDYSERLSTFTITTSAITLNLENAQVFSGTLNSNISSITISNPDPRTNTAQGFTILLMADGTARTITWPGAVKWASGTGPTLTSTSGKVDIFSFFSPNNGTTWYGFVGGQNF